MTQAADRRGDPLAPRPSGRASVIAWAAWLVALAVTTAAMLAVRPMLDKAHVTLVYLLLVLGAGATSRRRVAIALSIAAFLTFNFFFVTPYHTFRVGDRLDWMVLLTFLATSLVAAQLLFRARVEASVARQRTEEVERLATVGAQALGAGRAEDALGAIATVIGTTLGAAHCELYLRDHERPVVRLVAASAADGDEPESVPADWPGGAAGGDTRGLPTGLRLVEWVASSGRTVVQRADGSMRVDPEAGDDHNPGFSPGAFGDEAVRGVLIPLRVDDRVVGVLRLIAADSLALDPPRRRFLDALTYYAALGVERVRLVGEARHADALREADVLKDALLASVSHDLRTPLTTIKALAHSIRMEGDERAATIEEEADRLNRFVADLLDLSRIAGGALRVRPEINAVDDLLGATLQSVAGALGGREIDVRLDPDELLLLGRFDFPHALRIMVNLVENAARHDPTQSPVEITAQRVGDRVELVVMDRGPGVPAATTQRIFEPFYSAEGAPPAPGGAGLGLSISRQLAEAQGGTLTCEARAGGGSSFVLRLPSVDASELLGMNQSL